eukprot:7239779-Pyramimonas_sp.AAC.1
MDVDVEFDPADPAIQACLKEAGVDVDDPAKAKRLLEALGSAAKKPSVFDRMRGSCGAQVELQQCGAGTIMDAGVQHEI